jgi:uncharacterized protein YciI
MLFAFIGFDKKDGAGLRSAKVSAHLDYLHAGGLVKFAGPFLSDGGGMTGSLIIIDVKDRKAAEAWVRDEPFAKAGLFERSELHPWYLVMNSLAKA